MNDPKITKHNKWCFDYSIFLIILFCREMYFSTFYINFRASSPFFSMCTKLYYFFIVGIIIDRNLSPMLPWLPNESPKTTAKLSSPAKVSHLKTMFLETKTVLYVEKHLKTVNVFMPKFTQFQHPIWRIYKGSPFWKSVSIYWISQVKDGMAFFK